MVDIGSDGSGAHPPDKRMPQEIDSERGREISAATAQLAQH